MPEVLERTETTASPLYPNDAPELEISVAERVALEAPRYIFTAGDYIADERKEELVYLARGGEELLDNPCLLRTHNRFLPRCVITPLELGGQEMPLSLFPGEGVSVRSALRRKDTPQNPNEAGYTGRFLQPTFYYPFYPGECVLDATGEVRGGSRRGIVELTALRGVEWTSGEAQRMQSAIFPDNWKVPIQLRLVEERIQQAADAHADNTLRDVCRDMLVSCNQFRRYAQARIDLANSQLAQRQVHQHVYSYSAMVRLLMRQLEVTPVQGANEQLTEQVLKAVASSGVSDSQLAQLGSVIAEAVTAAIKAAQPKSTKE